MHRLFIVVRADSGDYPLYAGHIWSFYWNSRWHGYKAVETFFWSSSGGICNTLSFYFLGFQLSCNLLMCWTYSHCKRHLQPNRLGNLWCNDRNWRIIYQWLPNSNQRVSQLLPFVSSSCSIIAGFEQFIFFFLWPFMHTRMYHVKL